SFVKGLAKVEIRRVENGQPIKRFGYINRAGKVVIEPRFEAINYFSDGLAEFKLGGKWGYVNEKDEIVIAETFEQTSLFSEGLAAVRSGSKWGFIDKTAQTVIPMRFDSESD